MTARFTADDGLEIAHQHRVRMRPRCRTDDVKGDIAKKGDNITIPMEFRIRPSDKLYKLVKEEPVGAKEDNVEEETYSH